MSWPPGDERRIVRYLLGQLSDDERSEIERSYLSNPADVTRIEAVEVDLIDNYLEGSLSESDARLFEERYFSSSPLKAKVNFARAMRRSESLDAPPIRRYLLAAAALVLAVGLSWSLAHILRLTRAIGRLQTEIAAERQRGTQLEESLAKSPNMVASYFLSPGSERGMGERQSVVVPRTVSTVRLHLVLEAAGRAASYHATLRTFAEKTVWDWQVVAVRRDIPFSSVQVDLPVGKIDAGDYVLVLEPVSPGAPTHRSYIFRLLKDE